MSAAKRFTGSTRTVPRGLYTNYLKKAEELLNSMLEDHSAARWNACVVNAVHCGICAVDAVCVFHLGKRHSGAQHGEAVLLMKELNFERYALNDKIKQYSSLISVKTLAEYEDRLMTKKDAGRAKKNCERIFSWALEKLP